jgi:hypothetical protein
LIYNNIAPLAPNDLNNQTALACGVFYEEIMKEIKLSQGKVSQVSDHRFDFINQWRWTAAHDKYGNWHAHRLEGKGKNKKTIYMHRVIVNAPPNKDVDHRDGNGLNNQDENLRICTDSQNLANSKRRSDNTTGYKGVFLKKGKNKFRARITVNGKRINLGCFFTAAEANMVYQNAAQKYFGEFAYKNIQ